MKLELDGLLWLIALRLYKILDNIHKFYRRALL